MESINTIVLNKLSDKFQKVLDEAPEKRKMLHERVAESIKAELNVNINGSINDSHGTIRRWQIVAIGSGGGYAAIRPIGSKEGGSTGRNSPGAITNYLTNGFNRRKPAAGRKSRAVTTMRVEGKQFYNHTASRAQWIAVRESRKWADEIVRELSNIG